MRTANPASKGYWRPVSGDGARGQSNSVQSQVSHTPSPRTQREPMILDRNPVASPYTPAASNNSGERRSALERLQGAPDRVPLLQNGVANSDSGRLQELMRPSSSKAAGGMRAQIELEGHSPIRTLSEDRAHVSLRLGPLPTDLSPLPSLVKAAPKAAGKKPTRAPSTRAAVVRRVRSPAKGITLNKRRTLQSSPKLLLPLHGPPRRTEWGSCSLVESECSA
ncbi:unnamed protein product [Brassica rapa subsp. narinosa]